MPQRALLGVALAIEDEIEVLGDGSASLRRSYQFTSTSNRPDFSYTQNHETVGCAFSGSGTAVPAALSELRLFAGRPHDPWHAFWWEVTAPVGPDEPAQVVLITPLTPSTGHPGRLVLRMHVEERARYSLTIRLAPGWSLRGDPSDVEPPALADRLRRRADEEWATTEPVHVSMNETGPVTVQVDLTETHGPS